MRLLKGSFAAIIATLLLVLATLAPIAPVSAASVTTTLNVTSGPPGTQVATIGGFTPNAFFTVSYGTSTTLITSGTTISPVQFQLAEQLHPLPCRSYPAAHIILWLRPARITL